MAPNPIGKKTARSIDEAYDRLCRHAAVCAAFHPSGLLRTVCGDIGDGADRLSIAVIASRLSDVCNTKLLPLEAGLWLMRSGDRRRTLQVMHADGSLGDMIAWRRSFEMDGETANLIAILLDEAPLARADIEAAIRTGDEDALLMAELALSWAGEVAPSYDLRDAVRGAYEATIRAQLAGGEGEQAIGASPPAP